MQCSTQGQPVSVSMTSVNDVARLIAAALDLDQQIWPTEFRMQGDKKTVQETVQYAEIIKERKRSIEFWSSSRSRC